MKIKEYQEIILVETEKGDWKRVIDKKTNELTWVNEYKSYTKQNDGTWRKLSTRKYPEIQDTCELEEKYQQLLREEKLKRLMNKYVNTPFNYTGSKYKLLEQILPKLDYNKKYFIDLFAGGGSVYTNILEKYEKVLVNDIIEDLINIHKSLLESDDIIELTKKLSITKDSKDEYLELRESYNLEKRPEKLWALMLGCTSNLMRFNHKGFFNQTWGKRQWNSSTDKKVEEFINHIRKYKNKLFYTSKSFNKIIPKKESMIYIDPPYGYIKNGSNIGNTQISEAGYNAFYTKQNDIDLYNYYKKMSDNGHSLMISGVLKHKGKTSWILDKLINDGYNSYELDFDYKKVAKKQNNEKTIEVIITNYDKK